MGKNANTTKRDLEPALSEFSGFCPVVPVPKGRPRFNSRQMRTYTPAKTEKYERAVRKWMMENYGKHRAPMDGAIRARYEFVLERPASVPKKRWFSHTKPDIDNFEKSFQDALDFKMKDADGNALGVIANDSRIAAVSAVKRYAREGETPGTYFAFERVDRIIVLVGDSASADVIKMLDPSYRRVSVVEIESLKRDEDVEEIYAVLGGDAGPLDEKFISLLEKKFPNARKMTVI